MTTYQDIKSEAYLDAMIHFAETLLGIEFKSIGRHRYSAFCPFHAETKDSFRLYVNGKGEVRFHCFGACGADWDIYDVIMLRKKCRFWQAQQIWADYLEIKDFKPYDGKSPCIPEPDEVSEPEDTVEFVGPVALDSKIIAALDDAARFYNDLLMSNEDRFEQVWNYLASRGLEKDTIRKFNIGFAPPYKDKQYQGRSLIKHFLPRFKADPKAFQPFYKGGIVRLLTEPNSKGKSVFSNYIDYTSKSPFTKCYADYFATRIVFPIYGVDARPVGFVGRRPDNRRPTWTKQNTTDTAISTRGWLYGIDKAQRYIKQYRTIILVEGIFDYFAFYNLLQDQGKPVVVSTLGSYLTPEAMNILKGLDIEHFIVAYDCDGAGKNGIARIASDVGGKVYYLGGMEEGQDPYDKLKPVVSAISGFSLKYLMTAAKKAQEKTDKPVNVSFITSGPKGQRNVIFNADEIADMDRAEMEYIPDLSKDAEPKEYFYNTDDFLPLLTYDHANKAMLDQTIEQIIRLLEARSAKPTPENEFHIPSFFIHNNRHSELGAALILWLRLVIEQQARKKQVKETDAALAEWLHTSRVTISTYKRRLKDQGFLNLNTKVRPQLMSVSYHSKGRG